MRRSATTTGRYSHAHRMLEMVGIVAATLLVSLLLVRLATADNAARIWILGAAAIAGYVVADFLSGLAHWIFDTWGNESTPIIGPGFIRPFREHHTDPLSITRHGFAETNGNNCLASLPMLGGACAIPVTSGIGIFFVALLLTTSVGLLATNQIHKWAHVANPGALVRLLQRARLILSPEHHRIHHAAPYATHYCITTGWLNRIPGASRLHRRAEHLVTAVTRLQPHR